MGHITSKESRVVLELTMRLLTATMRRLTRNKGGNESEKFELNFYSSRAKADESYIEPENPFKLACKE
jgi:hypothetical protein